MKIDTEYVIVVIPEVLKPSEYRKLKQELEKTKIS